VTTVTRTLMDLASLLPLGRLRDVFERAERHGLLEVNGVDEEMRGRRGAKKIRVVLTEWADPEPTKNELEQALRNLCREYDIPLPTQNVLLLGYEVDALWEVDKTVVELDGWEFHRTRRAFEDDRRKAAQLEAAGYRVLRFSWRQIKSEPDAVAAAIRPDRARVGRRAGLCASRR
jgi:very-short-patch-repair endonuclease